jgi:hypothetical protein
MRNEDAIQHVIHPDEGHFKEFEFPHEEILDIIQNHHAHGKFALEAYEIMLSVRPWVYPTLYVNVRGSDPLPHRVILFKNGEKIAWAEDLNRERNHSHIHFCTEWITNLVKCLRKADTSILEIPAQYLPD